MKNQGAKMKFKIAAIATVIAITGAATAFAHSGGTDRSGCHMDHRTGVYHCH
jgi:hypothetical protein